MLRSADVLGADRYRITVFDHESKIVFAAEVDDTLLLLPESSVLKPGQPYVWIVEARTGWGRWHASAPVAFTIAPGGVPYGTGLFPLLAALAIQSPGADSLLRLATGPSEAALVIETRARPADVREAVAEGMARAARTPAAAPVELATARRLAVAYAAAWRDSFLRPRSRSLCWLAGEPA